MNINNYIVRGILTELISDIELDANILLYEEKNWRSPVKATLSTEYCSLDFQWLPNAKLLLITNIEVADNGYIPYIIQTKGLMNKVFHWAKIKEIRLVEADGVKVI